MGSLGLLLFPSIRTSSVTISPCGCGLETSRVLRAECSSRQPSLWTEPTITLLASFVSSARSPVPAVSSAAAPSAATSRLPTYQVATIYFCNLNSY